MRLKLGYSVDGSVMLGAGEPEIWLLENGVELNWEMLALVSKGAKELTFVVPHSLVQKKRSIKR